MGCQGARHSAGSLVAVDAYFQCPEKVAALILVAPALLAPIMIGKIADYKKSKSKETAVKGMKLEYPFWAAIVKGWTRSIGILKSVLRFLVSVISKLMGFAFRSPPAIWLVQRIMDIGGPLAVRYAFYDALKADKYVLDGYTRPLQSQNWERALLEYCLSFFDNSEDGRAGQKNLKDISCPVLIITGDTDRIVPDWNSENLAKVFPDAEFKRIKNCGHLPQEETPDEFLDLVMDWLVRTLKRKPSFQDAANCN